MFVELLLIYLKEVWFKVRDLKFLNFYKGRCCYLSSFILYILVECIFRFFLDIFSIFCCILFEIINRYLFGFLKLSFKNFMLEYWELLFFLMRKLLKGLDMLYDIFSLFTYLLICEGIIFRFFFFFVRNGFLFFCCFEWNRYNEFFWWCKKYIWLFSNILVGYTCCKN